MNDDANEIVNRLGKNNEKTTTSKSFKYETKIIVSTPDDNNRLHTEVAIPLKYLSNFCRFLIYL